jgi:uncharacterized Zn finger protein
MKRRFVSVSEHNDATRQQLLGEEWWTSAFLNLKRFGQDNSQLVKGRRLAERGQVIIQGIGCGGAEAVVLEPAGGLRKVSLWVTMFNEEWEIIFRIFSEHQNLFSRLITGEYPEELDSILKEAGIYIIPAIHLDLDYRCDCESHYHMCGHIIAVYLALGRYINEDPLNLFLLRGKTREDIIAGVASISEEENEYEQTDRKDRIPENTIGLEPADPSRYYEPGPDLDSIRFSHRLPAGKESEIIRLLGPSPFRLGESDLADIIAGIYPKAARYVKSEMEGKKITDIPDDPGNI